MRVALLRDLPQENWHSIEVYGDRLTQGLRALTADVEFIEVRGQAQAWPDLWFPTPYGRPASLRTLGLYLSRWVRYPLALRRVQADVYHVLDNSYGHLVFFLDPHRTVVTCHGGGSGPPRKIRQWNPEGPAMWMFDLAFRGTLRAARIVAVSEYVKQELLEETCYLDNHIHVVHHGIDPVFQPLAEAERSQWRAWLLHPGDCYLLLHVGHGAARKNVETLYQALSLLRREGWAVRLVRVGSKPTPSQARLIEELEIGQVVTHIPHVPNRDLPAYYAAADAFVFPSLYEGFGIPLIEAMSCGTPIVCSDWALFHEVCGDTALFADSRRPEALVEAIAQVLADPAMAKALRESGLERARRFTWERTAQAMLAVYREIMEETG
jgi:glycosyltransferase involved in cell wall biosynthesis